MNIVEIYNPAKSNALTDEQKDAMRDLTDDQIAQLAKAYPNQPRGNAYLVYHMKNQKQEDQTHPLGTWQNLHNLRKLGRKDILPLSFKKGFVQKYAPVISAKKSRVIDLSETEAKKAEGLKKPEETVLEKTEKSASDANPELETAKAELEQAIEEKAHHMTIKKLQAKVDELENK